MEEETKVEGEVTTTPEVELGEVTSTEDVIEESSACDCEKPLEEVTE